MKAARADVYRALDSERVYQDKKHEAARDASTPIAEWVTFMEYHLAQVKLQLYGLSRPKALEEVRKVTALGVACMEHHGAPLRSLE